MPTQGPAPVLNQLRIDNCIATPTAALLYFSDQVERWESEDNYQIWAQPGPSQRRVKVTEVGRYDPTAKTIILQIQAEPALKVGDKLSIQGIRIGCKHGPDGYGEDTDIFFARVNGDESPADANARRTTKAVEDSVAYPVMMENVGNPPASSYGVGAGSGGGTGSGSLQLSQLATQTITNVLGWKPKEDDAKGFVGALTQSFSLKDVEGHVEATWTPRTYAVQTDLAGGITGAQASLYMRAKEAMDQALPLLDGLYALNPDSDLEMASALKDMIRSQITELTGEMGFAGGPRISRVNQYFHLLLGVNLPTEPPAGLLAVPSDPDKVVGNLGRLRKELELQSFSKYVNKVEHEQNITNFRILSDYLTSLAQSWVNNLKFFGLETKHAFLGSHLVLLSRQLSVVADTVDEVRFTLDSVFIGAAERQTLQLEFSNDPALFIEDLLSWTQTFTREEGPQLIQTSGKLGVGDGFLPIVTKLHRLVEEARDPVKQSRLPDGYRTIRVKNSLHDLANQLSELKRLAQGVSSKQPPTVFDDQVAQTMKEEVTKELRDELRKEREEVREEVRKAREEALEEVREELREELRKAREEALEELRKAREEPRELGSEGRKSSTKVAS